jgi:hypothetical protein
MLKHLCRNAVFVACPTASVSVAAAAAQMLSCED